MDLNECDDEGNDTTLRGQDGNNGTTGSNDARGGVVMIKQRKKIHTQNIYIFI